MGERWCRIGIVDIGDEREQRRSVQELVGIVSSCGRLWLEDTRHFFHLETCAGRDRLARANPITLIRVLMAELLVGGYTAAFGVFGEFLCEMADGCEDLSGSIDILGSVLPDGLKALGVFAGEYGEASGDRCDAKIAAAR